MKVFFKQLRFLLIAALISTMLLAAFAACNSETGKNNAEGALTDKQKKELIALAEAFYESGRTFDENNALPVSQIEEFIYYLYNNELEADEGEYGNIPAETADARIKNIFGVDIILRTNRNLSEQQNFYFYNNEYHIRSAGKLTLTVTLKSVESDENGKYTANISVAGTDGAEAFLDITFKTNGDGISLISCKRQDVK